MKDILRAALFLLIVALPACTGTSSGRGRDAWGDAPSLNGTGGDTVGTGGAMQGRGTGGDGVSSLGGDRPTGGTGGATAVDGTGGTVDVAACTQLAETIASEVSGSSCTALVRLSAVDLAILGWSLDCGAHIPTTEADARAAFAPFADGCCPPVAEYRNVSGADPAYEYLFYYSPSDFGGMAVVSAATGHPLFYAPLLWSNPTSIRFPPTFRPASDLPRLCPPQKLQNLRIPAGLSELTVDPVTLARVADIVASTPIVPALGGSVAITNVLVVPLKTYGIYPPSVRYDEWLVFLN